MNDYEKSVYERFTSENWSNATYEERMAALQELAVISSTHNNNAPSLVKAEYLEGAEFGYYDGTGITVNRYVLENGIFVYHDEKTGKMESPEQVSDANIQMMDTIFHEDFHSFQDACISGKIPQEVLDGMGITQSQVQEWAANDLCYIEAGKDGVNYDIYRIQGMEKTAYDAGEKNTKEIFAYLNEKYGEDPNFQKYLESTKEYSFENSLNAAKERYQNPNIERALQDKMNAQYAAVNNGKTNAQNQPNPSGANKANVPTGSNEASKANAPNGSNETNKANALTGSNEASETGGTKSAGIGVKDTESAENAGAAGKENPGVENADNTEDDDQSQSGNAPDNDNENDPDNGGGGNEEDSGMDMD